MVRSLTLAMHGDQRMVLPLLKLKEFDQYTTTHALNVPVLSMGLAESLGCRPREIRAIGVAGLLHDIGKTRIPIEVLTKPGKLTDEERLIMNAHPVDGARLILQSEEDLDLAATVAYEHHIMLDGGGYPALHYRRECTLASRLVHVCDVYDALSTKRPYRDAWPSEKTLAYLEERAGTEFDPDLVAAFVRTLRQGDAQVRLLRPKEQPPGPRVKPRAEAGLRARRRELSTNSTRRTGRLGSALGGFVGRRLDLAGDLDAGADKRRDRACRCPTSRNRSPVTAAAAGDVPVPGGTRFSRFAPVRRYRVSLGVFASKVAAAPSARSHASGEGDAVGGFGGSGWGVPGVGFPRSSGGGACGGPGGGGCCAPKTRWHTSSGPRTAAPASYVLPGASKSRLFPLTRIGALR